MNLQTFPVDESQVTPGFIADVAEALDVSIPIRSWEVEGDGRLRLDLAYNQTAYWPAEVPAQPFMAGNYGPEANPIPAGDLGRLLKDELKELARIHGVKEWNRLRKADLVAALEDLR